MSVLVVVALAIPSFGFAEDAPAQNAGTSAKPVSRFRDPQDGQIDISGFLASPRAFLPIPLVITEPAVGYGGGLAGMFIRPRPKAGGEGFSRPNMSMVAAFGTENGTKGAFAGDASRWFDGRLKTLLGGGAGKVNLDFYGLGPDDESLDDPVSYSLDFSAAIMQGNWELGRDSPWAIGLRYVYAKVEPKLDDDPQFPGLADGIQVDVYLANRIGSHQTARPHERRL